MWCVVQRTRRTALIRPSTKAVQSSSYEMQLVQIAGIDSNSSSGALDYRGANKLRVHAQNREGMKGGQGG